MLCLLMTALLTYLVGLNEQLPGSLDLIRGDRLTVSGVAARFRPSVIIVACDQGFFDLVRPRCQCIGACQPLV